MEMAARNAGKIRVNVIWSEINQSTIKFIFYRTGKFVLLSSHGDTRTQRRNILKPVRFQSLKNLWDFLNTENYKFSIFKK